MFKQVWKLASGDDDAPNAGDEDRGWGEILAAAAIAGCDLRGGQGRRAIAAAPTGVRRLTGDLAGLTRSYRTASTSV